MSHDMLHILLTSKAESKLTKFMSLGRCQPDYTEASVTRSCDPLIHEHKPPPGKRKHDPDYIKCSFACCECKYGLCRPQYVLCGEFLPAESMKPWNYTINHFCAGSPLDVQCKKLGLEAKSVDNVTPHITLIIVWKNINILSKIRVPISTFKLRRMPKLLCIVIDSMHATDAVRRA